MIKMLYSSKTIMIIFIMCSILLFAPQPYYASWENVPFEEMIERADLIVIGKITGAKKERFVKNDDPDMGEYTIGYTDWEIQVISYLKVEPKGKYLLVTTRGVKDTDPKERVTFRSNEYNLEDLIKRLEEDLLVEVNDILFFLEERDGYYYPITPKAVVPLALIYWEKNINPNVININDISPEAIEELEFLKTFVEGVPTYSPAGKLQEHFDWFLLLGFGITVLIALMIWYSKRNKVTLF